MADMAGSAVVRKKPIICLLAGDYSLKRNNRARHQLFPLLSSIQRIFLVLGWAAL
jgi:hypothetical protein